MVLRTNKPSASHQLQGKKWGWAPSSRAQSPSHGALDHLLSPHLDCLS